MYYKLTLMLNEYTGRVENIRTLFDKTSSSFNTKDSWLSLVTMEPTYISIIHFKMILTTFMATANCIKDWVTTRKIKKTHPRRDCDT